MKTKSRTWAQAVAKGLDKNPERAFRPPFGSFNDKEDNDERTQEKDAILQAAGYAAIKRILAAVGYSPIKLDREELRLAIGWAAQGQMDLFRGSHTKPDIRHLERLAATTQKLARLLKQNMDVQAYLEGHFARDGRFARHDGYIRSERKLVDSPFSGRELRPATVDDVLEALSGAIAKTKDSRAYAHKHWRETKLRGSRKELIAGILLPHVFTAYFRDARMQRNAAGEPVGEMVNFVVAAMKEIGLPFEPNSVVRAWTKLKDLRESATWTKRAARPWGKNGK